MLLNLGTHPCAYIEVTGTGIYRGNNLTKYVYEGGSIRVSSFIFLVDYLTVIYYNISVIKEHLEVVTMLRKDYKKIQEQSIKFQEDNTK